MRKNFLKVLGLATILMFTNCQTDGISNTDDSNIVATSNSNTLRTNLQSFNKSFKYSAIQNNSLERKKWWQIAGQIAAVAVGDAGGAAAAGASVQWLAAGVGAATAGTGYAVVTGVAGVIGAAGGSYAAYCSTGGSCRGTFNNVNPMGSPITYDFPTKYDYLENFGTLHNNALQNIFMNDTPTNELTWIQNNIPNINQIDYEKLYNSAEFKSLKERIIKVNNDYRISGYNADTLLQGYKSEKLITDKTYEILSLYFAAVLKAQNFEDYKAITDFYVEEISNSELESVDKESLFSAFSISVQSYYYWSNLEIE